MFTFLRRRLAERAVRAAGQQVALGPEVQAAVQARPNPLQVLRRLEWTVIKRLDGQLQGDYRSLFRGAGLVLSYEALSAGMSAEDIIMKILQAITPPDKPLDSHVHVSATSPH